MMVIPPGQFTMTQKTAADGRHEDDPEGIPKSAPAREVTIDAAFGLAKYDVTVDEYRAFALATGRSGDGCYIWRSDAWVDDKTKSWRDPGFRQSGRDPVVCVNWGDAESYIAWLNRRLHSHDYRLPYWEEAEYAARAGATTDYYWGAAARRDRANYGADRCFPCQPERQGGDRWLYTSPVGSFPPNLFGLYDVSGNVWQWLGDCLRREPSGMRWGPPAPEERCNFAPTRGGSWLVNPEYLRIGAFASAARVNRNQATGFRVARVLTVAEPAATRAATTESTTAAQRAVGARFRDCPGCPVNLPWDHRRRMILGTIESHLSTRLSSAGLSLSAFTT
jgi:formylglycine-generating enzyme required for sulfatase activity